MPSGNRSLRPGNQRRLPSPGRRPGPAFAYAAACVVVAMSASVQLAAAEHRIEPGTPLQPAIEAAEPGDTIRLAPGRHAGPVLVDRTLSLVGEAGAVIAGPVLEGNTERKVATRACASAPAGEWSASCRMPTPSSSRSTTERLSASAAASHAGAGVSTGRPAPKRAPSQAARCSMPGPRPGTKTPPPVIGRGVRIGGLAGSGERAQRRW